MTYDLLIKGGHVLDPGQGLDGQLDIAVSGGKIARIAADIPAADAGRVLEIRGAGRHVVPGLIDLHTHVAAGAITEGVGMGMCDPDDIGVHSGVTTLVDCGSVGVANVGVFPAHILPRARTRVVTMVNAGSFAHTMPGVADVSSLDDINRDALAKAAESNPGLIAGVKLRVVGPAFQGLGEDIIVKAKAAATDLGVPLMVHIGDFSAKDEASAARRGELTRFLLKTFEPGDILTHLCTPNAGRVLDAEGNPYPEVAEARERGVVLDSALGRGNFGIEVARRQADIGLFPDTISSDLTAGGQTFHSLLECMAKFMSIGYTLSDVVRAATANAARALGLAGEIGAIAVGRDADLSIIDVVEGDFTFTDTRGQPFTGGYGLAPVRTVKAGEEFSPGWGTHPWGWLPATAS
ncbi:MAG TPA: amidohydrolase family protein [Trebonia sp.]|nr:amidohydrolase family protein [Trebonia sp.]